MAAIKAFGDKIGSMVAIDPRSGEILAMLSRPSFDPTEFSRGIPAQLWTKLLNDENHPLRDKAIQDHYSPGSTFKPFTAIAGLQEGLIDENTKLHCSGSIRFGNRVYHCWKKGGHGDINVVTAITQSCDVFFYRLAQKFKSVDDIAKWAMHFGLGKKTGISLAREVPGPNADRRMEERPPPPRVERRGNSERRHRSELYACDRSSVGERLWHHRKWRNALPPFPRESGRVVRRSGARRVSSGNRR